MLACGAAALCVGGGYAVGRNGVAMPHLASFWPAAEKSAATAPTPPTRPAVEAKRTEPATVKPVDRAALARLIKEPRPPASIPTPPIPPAPIAAPPGPPAHAAERGSGPLAISLLEKQIDSAADASSNVTLSLGFENLAGKPIRAFEGVLKLTDAEDNSLFSRPISVSALISKGETLQWDERLDPRKLDDKGRRLIDAGKDSLRAVFQVRKVFFVDGSVRKFGKAPGPTKT